jgi:hypothetical protein
MATTYTNVNLGVSDQLATKASKRLAVNSQSGTTYTLVQGDEDTGVETTNGSAVTVTAPQLAAGTTIVVWQWGAGQVTVVAGAGVTPRSPDGAKIAAQYKHAVLFWRSATEVQVSGLVTV